MNIFKIAKNINTAITVAGTAITAYQAMMKAFKWFEKKHNGDKSKQIIRPVIKGQ